MAAYYNENDPYAAAWLRNLIKAGHVADGEVDERSIADVGPNDLRGFTQCHFFAGIGGWSYALRLAGWPDERPVWTGSCPCQPFSRAGKQAGLDDPRHLWPTWFDLIRQRRPSVLFGEQVANAKLWFDRVCADVEGEDYIIGAALLPACAVDAPHRRDRLWFVAYRDSGRADTERSYVGQVCCVQETQRQSKHRSTIPRGSRPEHSPSHWSLAHWVLGADGKARRVEHTLRLLVNGDTFRMDRLRAIGNAIVPQVAAEFVGAYLDVCREQS